MAASYSTIETLGKVQLKFFGSVTYLEFLVGSSWRQTGREIIGNFAQ